MIRLSIVLPAYNEAGNIEYIYGQLNESLAGYGDQTEIIFVDDGSKDDTFTRIKKISVSDPRVKGIRFSRNFGVQSALMAGMKESKGEAVITMDSDGQHPATIIEKMMAEFENGYDIVNTLRLKTKDAGWFKRFSSKWFHKFINQMSDMEINFESSDFRLMSRKAVDAFLQIEEQNRFTRGLISWMGFRQTSVEYVAPERYSGETKWTYRKLLRLSIDGITAFSSKPLKISMFLGIIALVFGIVYSIYIFGVFITGNTIPGWPSMMITLLFLGGFQLLSIGIVGEYIARIFNETKRRPHYFIHERCGK